VAIAGGANGVRKLRAVPIWSFHGATDSVVPPTYARNCADELKRSKVFKYTEYPDEGSWHGGTVSDDPELHQWLFEQAKK